MQFGHQSASMAVEISRGRMFTGGAFSSYWNLSEPEGAQGQETSTSSASVGIGAVGASGAHVQLHSIRNHSTGYIFIDGMGIPSFSPTRKG